MMKNAAQCFIRQSVVVLRTELKVSPRYHARFVRRKVLKPFDTDENELKWNDNFDSLDESHLEELDDVGLDPLLTRNKRKTTIAERRWLKKKIIERKYFKKPQELNLLTCNAKAQIRYLNSEFPDEWTVNKLAQSFPISEEGVVKVLRANYIPTTQEEIEKHDQRVRKHWLAIRDYLKRNQNLYGTVGQISGGAVSRSAQQLVSSNKLQLMLNASGLDGVAVPRSLSHVKVTPVGPFQSLIKNYIENDIKPEKQSLQSELFDSKALLKKVAEMSKDNTSGDKTEQSESIGGRRLHRFKQNVNVSDVDIERLGLYRTGTADRHSTEIQSQKSQKVCVQTSRKVRAVDDNTLDDGVSDDYGDSCFDKLDIPDDLKCKGDLYQVGNSVYDEDGEFLYKIP